MVHSENVKQIFISNREEVTLNMNKPVPEVQFYKNIGKGEFLVNEDYKAKSILGLNQNCITCGNTGYVAAKAEFTDEGLRLFADGLSVFEIAKPPFMEGVNS